MNPENTERVVQRYSTVVADPPWRYGNPGEFKDGATPVARGGGSDTRYGSMSLDEIRALPVQDLSADDSHLYLWVTNAFVADGWQIAKDWGFRPITLCTWVKTTEAPIDMNCRICKDIYEANQLEPPVPLPIGVVRASPRAGYYFRGATEHCIFAVRGAGRATEKWREVVPTAWLWPRTPHSVKPDAFFDMVEQVSPGPYLELFARRNRFLWDTWGNQSLEHVVMGEVKASE